MDRITVVTQFTFNHILRTYFCTILGDLVWYGFKYKSSWYTGYLGVFSRVLLVLFCGYSILGWISRNFFRVGRL
jgi:hypothetical protein